MNSIEEGVPYSFIRARLERLEKERDFLEVEISKSTKKDFNQINVQALIKNTKTLLKEFDSSFDSSSISRKKELLHAFVNRVEVDQKQRVATCYINKIPEIVKVYQCRRSESNRHDVAIGGF